MGLIVDLLMWAFAELILRLIDKNAIESEKRQTGIDQENFIILDISTHGNLKDIDNESNEDSGNYYDGEW